MVVVNKLDMFPAHKLLKQMGYDSPIPEIAKTITSANPNLGPAVVTLASKAKGDEPRVEHELRLLAKSEGHEISEQLPEVPNELPGQSVLPVAQKEAPTEN